MDEIIHLNTEMKSEQHVAKQNIQIKAFSALNYHELSILIQSTENQDVLPAMPFVAAQLYTCKANVV